MKRLKLFKAKDTLLSTFGTTTYCHDTLLGPSRHVIFHALHKYKSSHYTYV